MSRYESLLRNKLFLPAYCYLCFQDLRNAITFSVRYLPSVSYRNALDSRMHSSHLKPLSSFSGFGFRRFDAIDEQLGFSAPSPIHFDLGGFLRNSYKTNRSCIWPPKSFCQIFFRMIFRTTPIYGLLPFHMTDTYRPRHCHFENIHCPCICKSHG